MEWVGMRGLSDMPSVPAHRLSSRWGQIWGFPGRLAWPQPCPGVSPSAHCPGTLMRTSPGAGRCAADVAVLRRHFLHILCPCQAPFANSPSSQPSLQSKHLADATWCCCSGSALGTGATVGGHEWENPLFPALLELWSRETGLQDWEGPRCLPGIPGDTCSTACQCSALGWIWLPAHTCVPDLWGCPKRWGHGSCQLPCCSVVGKLRQSWSMESLNLLDCTASCPTPNTHSSFPLWVWLFFFFFSSSSELSARSQRMG